MHVVIAGAGRVGGSLAQALANEGHDVVVVDIRTTPLEDLGKSFNGLTVRGQAFDVRTLREATIEDADVFAAMTNYDNINLMAVEVAKAVFEVPRVLARLLDPARGDSYRALGIPYVSTTALIASVVYERIVSEEFAVHVTFGGGDVEVVEFVLSASADGLEVGDLEIEEALRVAAVRRNDQTFIPKQDFVLAPGDLVVAAALEGSRHRVRSYLEASE
ncbi:MAG: TrkA family potassium uptake protein [Acidimicrobiia bacterium]|nr:TrkA family potassium uptake protein [Acidimicrobiia bacterium]